MQCTNHLKQIGLAVHNFHDTRNGVPPGSLGYYSANTHNHGAFALCFWPLIYPFIEQQNLYNYIQTRGFGGTAAANRWSSYWWTNPSTLSTATMNDEIRKQFGSVPIYQCPSRRGGGTHITPFPAPVSTDDILAAPGYGPRGCYAFVLSRQQVPGFPASDGGQPMYWASWDAGFAYSVTQQCGPFRLAAFGTAGDPQTWMPRDSIAWWADGTSNQILVGEKHLPSNVFENCTFSGNSSTYIDCSYLTGGSWYLRAVACMARNANVADLGNMEAGVGVLALPNDKTGLTHNDTGKFGSAHPGIVNFLFGDGAIRPLPLTTPPKVIGALGTVNDGNTVTIP
jgi:hypothetical protein